MSITRGGAATVVCAILSFMAAPGALADRLVAKGTSLEGKVKTITGKGVEFQPDFAKDPMLIPWENIDDLKTDARVQILYGDGEEVIGQISEYDDGRIEVGEVKVEPKSMVSAVALAADEPSFLDRTRSTLRYWHGGFDLGFNIQRATSDNLGAFVGLRALRSKGPTRLILGADYRYVHQKDKGDVKTNTVDTASGIVRGEYDFTKHVYGYASTDALYDAVQNLGLRAVPKIGAGYTLWEREPKEGVRDFFQIEAGGGWVYEKYLGTDGTDPDPEENDYFTIALGAGAAVFLPRGLLFDWRFDYLPSVSDFTGDYIVRTAAGLTVPLIAPVSARIGVVDTYDSKPADKTTEKNSVYLDTTLGLVW